MVVTYPSSVVGPAFATHAGVTEQGWVSITKSRMAPRLRGAGMMMIDVRDVADVHVALMRPGRGPKRYVCGGVLLTFDQMVDALQSAHVSLPCSFTSSCRRLLARNCGS